MLQSVIFQFVFIYTKVMLCKNHDELKLWWKFQNPSLLLQKWLNCFSQKCTKVIAFLNFKSHFNTFNHNFRHSLTPCCFNPAAHWQTSTAIKTSVFVCPCTWWNGYTTPTYFSLWKALSCKPQALCKNLYSNNLNKNMCQLFFCNGQTQNISAHDCGNVNTNDNKINTLYL